jgi:hypothetical protein
MSEAEWKTETKARYTPGPWTIDYKQGYWPYVVRGESGMSIMDRGGDHGRASADARLIAAAPDLLASAKRVLEHLEARIIEAPSNAVPVFDGIAELHDAINKAGG